MNGFQKNSSHMHWVRCVINAQLKVERRRAATSPLMLERRLDFRRCLKRFAKCICPLNGRSVDPLLPLLLFSPSFTSSFLMLGSSSKQSDMHFQGCIACAVLKNAAGEASLLKSGTPFRNIDDNLGGSVAIRSAVNIGVTFGWDIVYGTRGGW